MNNQILDTHIADIRTSALAESITTIDSTIALSNSLAGKEAEIARLMTVPILYSMWERNFTLGIQICLTVIRESHAKAIDCPSNARAMWLRKSSFYQSTIDAIRGILELDREDSLPERNAQMPDKIKKGTYRGAAALLDNIDEWNQKPLDPAIPVEKLVITYSNINKHVVNLNAAAIALDEIPSYQKIDFSKLDMLVAIRNGIGHGAVLSPPGHKETNELADYTKNLIDSYTLSIIDWLEIRKTKEKPLPPPKPWWKICPQ